MIEYDVIGRFENKEQETILRIVKIENTVMFFVNNLANDEAIAFTPTRAQLVEIGKAVVKAWEVAP